VHLSDNFYSTAAFFLFVFFTHPFSIVLSIRDVLRSCFSKKQNQKKGAFFYEVFFMLFYRTHKNRLKSAKFSPRLQKFLTRFLTALP
jgi:hypothetical protein